MFPRNPHRNITEQRYEQEIYIIFYSSLAILLTKLLVQIFELNYTKKK